MKLHMAYCFSYDRAWMIVVWTDDCGELLEYALFHRKTAYKDAWERTKQLIKRAGTLWTIVLAKIGLMFHDELLMWLRTMSDTKKGRQRITIISIDLESTLNIHFYPGIMSSSIEEPNQDTSQYPYSPLENSKEGFNASKDMTETQILVLNHRISYSHKREKAFKGILQVEAIADKENWITPLATGYLVHHSLPNKNLNPVMEQFNNDPFIAEVKSSHRIDIY